MALPQPAGEPHAAFQRWAEEQGVQINGVEPASIPGRGMGMVATRDIHENEVVLTVPRSTILSIENIPSTFREPFQEGIPLQGLMAAYLIHGDRELLQKYDLWRAVWPSRADLEDELPVLWPEKLRRANDISGILIPPAASGQWNTLSKRHSSDESRYQQLLPQQERRLRESWEKVLAAFPETDWELFSYYWLIINTRSFYYVPPGESPPEDWNEALALVPFADYFNHVDGAKCKVWFDEERYYFLTLKKYEKGEEVYMNYGPHSNDFLLVEYGFFLDTNASDAVYLDDIIFNDLTSSEVEDLKNEGYYGEYRVTEIGPCYRTEVAASMKHMPRRSWRKYVRGEGPGPDERHVNRTIAGWIAAYTKEAGVALEKLHEMLRAEQDESVKRKGERLVRRWEQIRRLCEEAASKLDS